MSGFARLGAQRGLRGVEHAVELAEHPVMTAALDHIEAAIGQRLGKMIGGPRRDDLRVPDASTDSQVGARQLSDLRDGA